MADVRARSDGALVAAGLAVSAWLVFEIAARQLPHLRSDGLHTFLLVRDLIERGGDVVWQCTRNFYFFPALAFVAAGEAAFDDLGLVHLAAFAMQALALLAAALVYGRVAAPQAGARPLLLAAVTLTVLYLAAGALWPDVGLTIFMPTNHGMHFPVALLVLALFLADATRPSAAAAAAFVALSALLLLSDLIFFAWLFAPLALASFVAFALVRRDPRGLLRAALLIGGAAAASGLAKLAVEATGRFNRRTMRGAKSLEEVRGAFAEFLRDLPQVDGALWLALVALVVALAALAPLWLAQAQRLPDALASRLGEPARERLLWASGVTFLGLALGAAIPLATGVWSHRAHARFFVSLAFFPSVWIAHAALAAGVAGWPGGLRAVALASVVLGAVAACSGFEGFALARVRAPHPERVAALDALASQHGLRVGLGGYWIANETRALSRSGLRVLAVEPDLDPYVWSTSADVYFETDGFDFVILEDLDRDAVRARLGPPREVLHAGSLEVWRYDRASGAFAFFRPAALAAVQRRGLLLRDRWRLPDGAPRP
jgi:hypothetical protein